MIKKYNIDNINPQEIFIDILKNNKKLLIISNILALSKVIMEVLIFL
jgi:hypothetical protein